MLRRVLVVVMSLVLVASLTACGNKQSRITHAETEGVYVDLGNLKYQVQISRPLNPQDIEDREYLRGVSDTLGPQDEWFAVFVRVENASHKFEKPATQYDITDTLNNTFNPVNVDTKANSFAYNPIGIPGNGVIPNPDSLPAQTSINGEMLLFKIPRTNLDNRPLILQIHDPQNFQTVDTVTLDV
ncbi:MAG TPA: hypothetical protein VFL73_11710 [Solirubrobacteraceae bacterium]|nr:hypothetical protein [Solirubrobacteraceae bacterium]